MRVEDHCIVTMSYKLREQNEQGAVLEVMDTVYPFIFFYPADNLLPAFQRNIHGLDHGAEFAFTLSAAEAYGTHQAAQVVSIPVERFIIDQEGADTIRDVGQYVAVRDDQGRQQNGKIVKKTATELTVDLNHAMVDKDLYFQGKILRVRPASVDEIIQKRYIMPDGIRF